MLKETPVGAPIDRSQRHGSPTLLLLITLLIVGAVVGMVYLDERQHALFMTLFLAFFAAIGVLVAFLYAIGILQFAGRSARNDITKSIVDTTSDGHLVIDREGGCFMPTVPIRRCVAGCPAALPVFAPWSGCSPARRK